MSDTDFPRGYTEALARAREIEALDSGFVLDVEQTLTQGKNNRLLSGSYHGRPALLKYFNDCINKPGAMLRKGIERFALAHFAGLPPVPCVLAEPQLLFRYDNNFSNMLIHDGQLVGLVDFEQCYLGTETILLGALLDTVPEIYPLFPKRPPWTAIRCGYEAQRGAEIDPAWFRHIVAMAMLNHWYRIVDTHSRLGTIDQYLVRFESRFPILKTIQSTLPEH